MQGRQHSPSSCGTAVPARLFRLCSPCSQPSPMFLTRPATLWSAALKVDPVTVWLDGTEGLPCLITARGPPEVGTLCNLLLSLS